MTTQATDLREREKLELTKELRELEPSEFRTAIRRIGDDGLLADLRYAFGYDQDPTKSSWQTREINRLLTTRKQRRQARPQWIGILVAALLSLASLVVSILAFLKD